MEKKIFTIVFAALVAMATLAACSNDDAPAAKPTGEEMIDNIWKVIEEQINAGTLYLPTDASGPAVIVTETKEAAHALCERLILDEWDGQPRTVTLPDNCGRVSLTPAADAAAFCIVSLLGVSSTDDMTFILAREEYMDGDNLAIDQYFPAGLKDRVYPKCPECEHQWSTIYKKDEYTCPECEHVFEWD